MGTETKSTRVRIHVHFGRVVVNGADGYMSPEQAIALAEELRAFALDVTARRHRCTRLVLADGSRVNESDGASEPTYV